MERHHLRLEPLNTHISDSDNQEGLREQDFSQQTVYEGAHGLPLSPSFADLCVTVDIGDQVIKTVEDEQQPFQLGHDLRHGNLGVWPLPGDEVCNAGLLPLLHLSNGEKEEIGKHILEESTLRPGQHDPPGQSRFSDSRLFMQNHRVGPEAPLVFTEGIN
ncbi:hypothetical protein P7K49_005725 [Saguinus oedipus]|uniref:Uncharacterized protein n=1 Tax=Saguinus oedipus TaxID=9490 RepID=A0ABQ9W0F9_SAGOE|nr:hypothetical protein P7K49_005725 [Saguinus oedipus]